MGVKTFHWLFLHRLKQNLQRRASIRIYCLQDVNKCPLYTIVNSSDRKTRHLNCGLPRAYLRHLEK